MSRNLKFFLTLGWLSVLLAGPLLAQAPNPEAKLRENLRATMLQLRSAETERATLQAAAAENELKLKELTDQLAALTKLSAANQTAADKSIAELKAKVDERDREIGELRVSLEKWKVDHKKISELANQREAQRAKLATETILLTRRVADQQTRNLALFKTGTEILNRYEKFGLGEALLAREPFTGITRVKLETLVQEDRDKLLDQKIKPDPKP